jgi:hypothetical protein
LSSGAIGAGVALVVAAVWFARERPKAARPALESTLVVTITRHDAFGMPGKRITLRDRDRVRALVGALGVDQQPEVRCPPDYATAEIGMTLGGGDVYARRDAYVWDLEAGDGGASPRVVVVSSGGCRGGAPADVVALRRELAGL